jgi:hypothetical protein
MTVDDNSVCMIALPSPRYRSHTAAGCRWWPPRRASGWRQRAGVKGGEWLSGEWGIVFANIIFDFFLTLHIILVSRSQQRNKCRGLECCCLHHSAHCWNSITPAPRAPSAALSAPRTARRTPRSSQARRHRPAAGGCATARPRFGSIRSHRT